MAVTLKPSQEEALRKMHNGCILNGGTGSGKSITGLAYYFIKNGGSLTPFRKVPNTRKKLYIITIAKKRDNFEWDKELARYLICRDENTIIDSWNNIKKYENVKGAFFIFDEQKTCGGGAWSKTFIKLAKVNDWILLSATPGDSYKDYLPIFLANGYFKNKTQFYNEHCVFNRHTTYPQIDRYVGTKLLDMMIASLLIPMPVERDTVQHHIDIVTEYDRLAYKQLMKERFNISKNKPIESASELCYELRKICNSADGRVTGLVELLKDHPRAIIFYNYDYELEAIKGVLSDSDYIIAEWNGHKHQDVPRGEKWVYLCNYNSCAEAWECTTTDTIIFYSQSYSYKIMTQASGRIDRLNSPYIDLYYFHMKTRSNIDLGIDEALRNKKDFNENRFVKVNPSTSRIAA